MTLPFDDNPAPEGSDAAPLVERPPGPVVLPVDVIRSPKRRKTVQARVVDGRLELRIPARMSKAEEAHWITEMRRRFVNHGDTDRIDLAARCRELSRRYDLPAPESVRWVTNQGHRWGSCTPVDGTIRISHRLAPWPRWVLDYVLVHELSHLLESGHGPRFHALVDRYPFAERARGFLIAKSGVPDPADPTDAGFEADDG